MKAPDFLGMAFAVLAVGFGLSAEFTPHAFFSTIFCVFFTIGAAYFIAIGYVERIVVPALRKEYMDELDRRLKDYQKRPDRKG